MDDYLSDVAIIGAGLGGCALALALSERNVPITIYESRPEISDVIPSGVVLTPNGLRILDHVGVFDRIKDRCYVLTHRVFKNDNDETTKKTPIGDPKVAGYRTHRVWRKILFDEMRLMLKERSIDIKFNSRFNGIVSNTEDGVTFLINDNEHHASLLIGSDGIYSAVRKHLAPAIKPEYAGLVGILSHIPWNSVAWPSADYERNATIQSKPGAIFWIAEDPRGDEIMIGKQIRHPELSRADLDSWQRDPDKLASFYLEDYDEYGPTARKIIDSVCAHKQTLYIWPYMKMPPLAKWYSASGRVVLLGDAAHAMPPSSGQGVNQALEDIYSLTLLLTSVTRVGDNQNGESSTHTSTRHDDILDALAFWQAMRQERIDAILEWTNNTSNLARLPQAEREELVRQGRVQEQESADETWLFVPRIDERVMAWVESRAERRDAR